MVVKNAKETRVYRSNKEILGYKVKTSEKMGKGKME